MQNLKGKNILLAEDNPVNILIIKQILSKYGIVTRVAVNGEEATELFQVDKYDLVLMDLQMPLKNGYEALEYIREFDNTIPVIALTASSLSEIEKRFNESTFNDFLEKPFKEDDIISKIEYLIG